MPARPPAATSTATAGPRAGATPSAGASSPATAAWRCSRGCRSTPAAARSFRLLPWSALPGALLPEHADGSAFPDPAARAALRLSSRAHWDVPVRLPDGRALHLLASDPTPPLFDGPEGFNRRRNHDEIAFWTAYLDGTGFRDDAGGTAAAPAGPLVVLGDLGIDPLDGAGLHDGIARLLAHPRLHDPRPRERRRRRGRRRRRQRPPARARRHRHRRLARRRRPGQPPRSTTCCRRPTSA